MDDLAGEWAERPGEGKRGAMSGGNSAYGETGGGYGRTAGADEIVGVSMFTRLECASVDEDMMNIVMDAARKRKQAIF